MLWFWFCIIKVTYPFISFWVFKPMLWFWFCIVEVNTTFYFILGPSNQCCDFDFVQLKWTKPFISFWVLKTNIVILIVYNWGEHNLLFHFGYFKPMLWFWLCIIEVNKFFYIIMGPLNQCCDFNFIQSRWTKPFISFWVLVANLLESYGNCAWNNNKCWICEIKVKKPFFSFKYLIVSPLNLMAFVLEQ